MKYKNTTERLKGLKHDNARLSILLRRKADIDLSDGLKGICYEGDRVQTSPTHDGTERLAITNVEKAEKLEREIRVLELSVRELEDAIGMFPSKDKNIIDLVIDNQSWTCISDEVKLCEKQCRLRFSNSVTEIENVLKESG